MSDPKSAKNGKAEQAEAEEGNGEQKAGEDQDMKEQLLRLAAEFDNYKKRTRKDIENAKAAGAAETMRDMLPILDEFYIANIAAAKSSDKDLRKGMEMLYSNLLEALKRRGLREVGCEGAYNPYVHEIMMTREEPKAKPGTIVEVVKRGYMLGEILLRPASVIVAADNKAPAEEEAKKENDDTNEKL